MYERIRSLHKDKDLTQTQLHHISIAVKEFTNIMNMECEYTYWNIN